MKKILFLMAAICALSACGEREQVVQQQPSEKRYQGKHDSSPWENAPLALSGSAGGGKWTKGDRASWEEEIKHRQQGQNEDRRIYQ